jgi:putative spermidine/putrescine transport system ATP-binding protein
MRYEVSLDAGGQLAVVRPNRSGESFRTEGRVRLSWRHEHNVRVPDER